MFLLQVSNDNHGQILNVIDTDFNGILFSESPNVYVFFILFKRTKIAGVMKTGWAGAKNNFKHFNNNNKWGEK